MTPDPHPAPVDEMQAAVTRRYDRSARFYDLYDKPMDLMGVRGRRKRLLSKAKGRTLEVRVGTGRNLDFYPDTVTLTGVDISNNMLQRARAKANRRHPEVTLDLADVQHLPYGDASFDTVTATCVFCSVVDPIAGLAEVGRVAKPGGQVLLVEHVRPRTPVMGWLFDRLAPPISRLLGPEINRRAEDNVTAAGLEIVDVRRSGIWREITARPSAAHRARATS